MDNNPTRLNFYLLPCPLGEGAIDTIPSNVQESVHQLSVFIVERAKTARRFIKATGTPYPISSLHIYELDKHDPHSAKKQFDLAIQHQKDIGILSEAGCPGVADPGAELVRLAHQKNYKIIPLIGPSSILLGLMASGMNGQSFAFQGYLPSKKPELLKKLKQLEATVKTKHQTQIFIEAPYRNKGLLEQILQNLSGGIRLCLAVDITLPTEWIQSKTIAQWKKTNIPDIHKRPAIFLLGK